MIVTRNVFHLKFGKAREAVALMKESVEIQKKLGVHVPQRILTDLTGTFYTLVLEITVKNLAEIESTFSKVMSDKEFHANYEKFTTLVESGYREMFTIVEEA